MGKICTFGYVITDVFFKPIEKKDVLIRPNSYFEWYVQKNILSYRIDAIKKQPDFRAKYAEIKALLEKPDRKVFGFNVGADMGYLMSECFRYNLPFPDFEAVDIQKAHQIISELEDPVGLEKAIVLIGDSPEKYKGHKSDEDAVMSMRVLKYLARTKKEELGALLENPVDGVVYKSGLSCTPKQILQKIIEEEMSLRPKDGPLSGKVFAIDEAFEKNKTDLALKLIMEITGRGGEIYYSGGPLDFYLSYEEYRAGHPKTKEVRWGKIKDKKGVRRMDINEFAAESGIEIKRFGHAESEEIRRKYLGA